MLAIAAMIGAGRLARRAGGAARPEGRARRRPERRAPPESAPHPAEAGELAPMDRGGALASEEAAPDAVDESSLESFPASDPPGWTPVTGACDER